MKTLTIEEVEYTDSFLKENEDLLPNGVRFLIDLAKKYHFIITSHANYFRMDCPFEYEIPFKRMIMSDDIVFKPMKHEFQLYEYEIGVIAKHVLSEVFKVDIDMVDNEYPF